MRFFVFASIILTCLTAQVLAANNNGSSDFDVKTELLNSQKEVSEIIWEVQTMTDIQDEYGSPESTYFNNRGNADASEADRGGSSFNSIGY